MLFASLARMLELDGFITQTERALDVGALLHPSHWIAGHEKLEMFLKMSRALRAFQASLPTVEQVVELEAKADRIGELVGL
jgi:hypothetical protein